MKILTLKELDLSKYKLAYYVGQSISSYDHSQDYVMKMTDAGMDISDELHIALIPKDKRLQDCSGDDWNDCPADHNASGFYRYPEGTIFLKGKLGGELRMEDKL